MTLTVLPRLLRVLVCMCVVLLLSVPVRSAYAQTTITVWHAYQGEELNALQTVLARAERTLGITIRTLAVPFDAYASKLENGIPHGQGPDVFIDAHERLSSYLSRRLVTSIDEGLSGIHPEDQWESVSIAALTRSGHLYAFPLSIKCIALYYNTQLVSRPPETFEEIVALRERLPRGVYPLVHYAENAYFHAPFAHAFGSALLDDQTGAYLFATEQAVQSVQFMVDQVRSGVIPEETDGALVEQLFASGGAATAISGSWLAAKLTNRVNYRVAPLPMLTRTGQRLEPLATVEGAFVSAYSENRALAMQLARILANDESAIVRASTGRQVVANKSVWTDASLAQDHFLQTFREAARHARPMPTHPFMRSAFEPANQALRKAITGRVAPRLALEEGLRRFRDATRELPKERSPTMYLLLVGLLGLLLAGYSVYRVRDPDFRKALSKSTTAYKYVAHAVVIVFVLVVVPLVIGAATSLFAGREGKLYFVGVANYWDIITARGGSLLSSGSFYVVLLVTILWTIANITLHVVLGVLLALILTRPDIKARGLFRVLLIVPWAVPSYVTALAWKGMFHRQMGAINAILGMFGVNPVAWFAQFSTAFTANLATNVWLGFPFMMVVTMGALAAIPKDLYEAAAVDGASAWQRFWKITVPMLRPGIGPAVTMGAVWTFNMFNVIYLVSGGQPDGQTEILVTEAYRWAFTRQAQYGYASAYAVLIFGVLVLGTRLLSPKEATR